MWPKAEKGARNALIHANQNEGEKIKTKLVRIFRSRNLNNLTVAAHIVKTLIGQYRQ